MKRVKIVGGGLAGSEAAYQVAKRGGAVTLFEMRPSQLTKAHKTGKLAELVCSNSFRGADLTNAVGLLKEELRIGGSLIMEAADAAKVPAGGALAVDREVFSSYVDGKVRNHPLIEVREEEIKEVPLPGPDEITVVATGPLTSHSLSSSIADLTGAQHLSFFDAISPIVLYESLDLSCMFMQSRYGKGEGSDYLNIPLSNEQYLEFVADIMAAEKFGGHQEVENDQIEGLRPFEGCMPIEEMASRGIDTLRHGPMKPVGLTDPRDGKRPYAVIQLRRDDLGGELWSIVGFQTRMKHPEQLRVFRKLPGFKEAEFVRLGTVHRNSFIESPKLINPTLSLRDNPRLFFAGQITGVEGYVESTAAGLVAGINASRLLSGIEPIKAPIDSATGALLSYISDPTRKEFQPMNVNFGLMPSYFEDLGRKVGKDQRRHLVGQRALASFREFIAGA